MSETTTHSPSLREALAASYDAHVGTDTGESAPAPAAPAADTTDTAQSPAEPAAASGSERQRDASGRFAPAAAAAATDTNAPDGYDPAVWAMLSPEAREKTAAWAKSTSGKYEPFNGLDRVLTQQRRDGLAMQYGSVDHALEQLFHLSDFAARDPNGFVRQFAAQRGVNLAQLMQQAQGGGQPQQQFTPEQAIQAMVQQEIDRRDVDRLYNEFAGQSELEHRNDPQVRRTMASLLKDNLAMDYRSAYDMAVRAHPDFGPKWAAATAAASAKDQQAVAAETARARASAASSLSGAPGTTRPSSGGAPATVRDALQRAFDSAGGARV